MNFWNEIQIKISQVLDLMEEYEIQVDSPDGWVPIVDFVDKGIWKEYILKIDGRDVVRCNEYHLFETNYGWKLAKELVNEWFFVLTDSGEYVSSTIIETENLIPIVDIQVDHQNHRYYTNGISSHNTNVGKSLAMCHMAAANVNAGKNVLYITCEMAEERIAERIDANILDITLDTLRQISKKQFMNLVDNLKTRTSGKLVIKEYPTGSANVSHFRYLLHELAIKKNFIPDIIYLDYLNICSSSRIKNNGQANSYTLVKSIAEEVRGLAVESNLPIVTATQFTRCLSVHSLVNTPNSLKRLHEIQIGDKVLTTNGEYNTVLKVYPKEVQQAYIIRLKTGKTIKCSENHIFPTPNGMKSISSGLAVGDNLFINRATQ